MLNAEQDLFHSTATHPHFLISLNGFGLALVLLASACASEQGQRSPQTIQVSQGLTNPYSILQPASHWSAISATGGDLPRLELFQVSLRMELRDKTLPSSFAFDLGEGAGATAAKSRKNSGEGTWKGWLVDVWWKFHNRLWRNNDRGQQL